MELFSSFVFAVSFSLALPLRHSFERILTFHSFLALLAFSFSPESCVLLVTVPCCITFFLLTSDGSRVLHVYLSLHGHSIYLS